MVTIMPLSLSFKKGSRFCDSAALYEEANENRTFARSKRRRKHTHTHTHTHNNQRIFKYLIPSFYYSFLFPFLFALSFCSFTSSLARTLSLLSIPFTCSLLSAFLSVYSGGHVLWTIMLGIRSTAMQERDH